MLITVLFVSKQAELYIELDPVKNISINGPNHRYVMDITYLNEDMSKSFGIKYLVTIIYAFNRKATVYSTNTKKSECFNKVC